MISKPKLKSPLFSFLNPSSHRDEDLFTLKGLNNSLKLS
jgi:hypothetical protein